MTTLFGYRQRAEDFAARVDGGPAGLPEAGSRRGGAIPETDALVGLVAALREHAELDDSARPSPAFTTDLRDRLLAEAALTPARTPATTPIGAPPQTSPSRARSSAGERAARPSRARERLVVAGTAAAILIGGTAGVANAAQNALPGQALYPVKRSIEGVNAGLSGSSSAHGRALLDQASTRLDEVRGLDAGGPLERELIPGTLDEFTRQAHEGAQLLMLGYRETDDPKSIEEVRAFAANQLPVLTTLSSSTSDGAEFQLRNAAVALRSIDSDASTACANCSDLAPLDLPPVALAALEVDGSPQAASNGASDLLPTRKDEGAGEGDGVDAAGAPLPGTGSAPAATPTGDALLLPGVSPSGATPTTPGAAGPAATNGAQPAAGTGIPVIPGASAAAPGSLPGTVGTPSTGTGPGSSTSAPPRIPILILPSGVSVATVSSTPSGVVAPSSQPAPSPAPVVPGPSVPVVPTPVATSPAAPTGDPTSSSGSSGSSSTGSSTSGSSGSTASSSNSTSSSTDSLTSTDGGSSGAGQ